MNLRRKMDARSQNEKGKDAETVKKLFSLLLALLLMLNAVSALALDFPENLKNEATFETFEEAEANAPAFMAETVYGNPDRAYAKNPVLDGYPEGTTYIYRSANLYGGGTAAPKLNTTVVVFAGEALADKDAAKAYLDKLGVLAEIDKMIGSVVLVTPIGEAWGEADAAAFAALQKAFLAQQASAAEDGSTVYYPEGEYFGCYGEQYVIGVDGGASFVYDFIASNADVAGTVAGVLLIGGEQSAKAAVALPAYLVGASDAAVENFKAVNEVTDQDGIRFYRASKPAQCVFAAEAGKEPAAYVADAFANLFARVMRLSATNGTLPYSIVNRCAIIDGKTVQDVYVTFHDEDRFSDVKCSNGEYLDVWYEALPAEVLDGTAEEHSVPLILCLHGMGDDPLMFIYNQGLVELAGEERVALVSPFHQDVFWVQVGTGWNFEDGIEATVMPMLVKYMLDEYPALDPARVYITGYSMGGWATQKSLYGDPRLFAAVVPMSGMGQTPTEEQAAEVAKYDLPILITTSTQDLSSVYDAEAGGIGATHQETLNKFLAYNDMAQLEYDFAAYPMSGFKADTAFDRVLNEEYANHTWYLNNKAGVPMVGLSITEGLVHSLYPEFAKIMWDYARHFSRNLETGEVIYNPNAD